MSPCILDIQKHQHDITELIHEVFIQEQGFQEEHFVALVKDCIPLGVWNQHMLAGYCQIRKINDQEWKIERVCIRKEFRSQGIGRRLLQYGEAQILQHKGVIALLNAQYKAIPFYQRMQYQIYKHDIMIFEKQHALMKKNLKGDNLYE